MKDKINVKRGKVSKAKGKAFEIRVRKDLIDKGWIVSRFDNDVKDNELVQAKTSWRRTPHGMFPMNISPGFPDYLCLIRVMIADTGIQSYEVIGVESKMEGELDKKEKEKCVWLLKNNIFSKILIAKKLKVKNRIVVEYSDFKEKYWRFYKK